MNRLAVDLDALLCALVLAPRTYARNRFFTLFEDTGARRVRRRAARVRGIVRQLLAQGRNEAEIVGEQRLDDGRWLVRYRVQHLEFNRTVALTALEAAVLRYAMSRAGKGVLGPADRAMVHDALARLAPELMREAMGKVEPEDSGESSPPPEPPGVG